MVRFANSFDHTSNDSPSLRIDVNFLLDDSHHPLIKNALTRMSLSPQKTYTRISLRNRGNERRTVTASLLASTLEMTKRLVCLELSGIDLDLGDSSDALSRALANMMDLKEVKIGLGCRLLGNEESLASFACGMMKVPRLEAIVLNYEDMPGHMVSSLNESILRIPNLVSLHIIKWSVSDIDGGVAFLTKLLKMGGLKRLSIGELSSSDKPVLDAFCTLLSNSTLKLISVLVNDVESLRSIANSLRITNPYVEKVVIYMDYEKRKAVLNKNDAVALFLEVLRDDNFLLSKLKLPFEHPDIDFYLNLNSLGRHQLLKDEHGIVTDQDWLNAIAASEGDVPTIFYWLTCYLSLCQKADLKLLDELDFMDEL